MDEVSVLCLVVGRCADACLLLLDLVVWTSTLLLRLLCATVVAIHGSMVALCSSTLVEYGNFALISFLTATEAVSGAAFGVLHHVGRWLQALAGVFEGLKMVGHLFCHVTWRIKDVLHRGFLSGSSFLRQTCEGICILLSLVLYFVNTVVNVVLLGTQNCLSALADVWEAVADPVHRVVELALTLLTFLYSCLVGFSVLLWTSCQLLLDSLGAFGRVFIPVVLFDCHSLLVAATVTTLIVLFLKPRLRVLAGRLGRQLAHKLYAVILEAVLVLNVLHTRALQDINRRRSTQSEPVPPNELSFSDAQQDGDPASSTSKRDSPSQPGCAQAHGDLLRLLKEQEERKKCVICQDRTKTVLLLPCRHLCLCRLCADILSEQRPVQQRCCPLCRQHITQTMDVFL